ncbi:SufS family cysteine desulfurase [Effusibacillus dendaii]|uniref:cysteine desulfurase n=1 Tax=Effusibacillus dendaii TaxID=2743772 RepID=A0A7I8DDM0_9BACL|nr:SufS family cysteine desulfurase [Effusibacillus dendaii]BCJ87059.1 cysteine desulfurase SufS [Effusibacillus dendaii]
MFNVQEIKKDFAALQQQVNGKSLVYLDSAASSQIPKQVAEAMSQYYATSHSNVHRGVHTLGERATSAYEGAREKVARFLNAPKVENIVFTRGTTESINLVAYAYGLHKLQAGDGIVVTLLEHHSNLVPWQQIAKIKGAKLYMVELTEEGHLNLEQYRSFLKQGNIKIVAVTQASNVLGTVTPTKQIVQEAHAAGAVVVVDAAQSAPHMAIDVQDLDADFLAASGHKMLGPTGIGFLYGKSELLDDMEPFQMGGSMIGLVDYYESNWAEVPAKFEAGTPNIVGAVGLAAAIDYLNALGMENVHQHEQQLLAYAWDRLSQVEGIELYGPRQPRTGLIAFNIDDTHPHDVSTVLDAEGVAVRAGHHCAQPLHKWLHTAATNRASFYIYNDEQDIDRLVAALQKVKEMFGYVTR